MDSNATAKLSDTQTQTQTQNQTRVQEENRIVFRNPPDREKMFIKGGDTTSRVHYHPAQAPGGFHDEEQEAFVLSPMNGARIPAKRSFLFRTVQAIGALASIAWIGLCVIYFLGSVSEGQGWLAGNPYEMGIFVAGMIAPVAFFWMILSYMQRNSDVRYYAESLREEMHTLFFPSDEDSRRVNRDIERMTQQAAELAASSKAALKAIQRTRQGLRHEIKEFITLARKAEHHIMGLSDTMVERTGNLSEVTGDIEARIASISEKSQASITVWDEASARMIERAGDIEISMEKGANRILSVADTAESKSKAVTDMFDGTITSLGLTVDAVIDRLSGINDEFGTHTRTLSRSSEDLSKETGRLGQMIEDQVEQLQEAAGRSVETITQSLIAVQDQKDILEDTVSTLSAKANDVASIIAGSVDRLDQSAETITVKAEAIEDRITEKSKAIANSLDDFDAQIDRIDTVSEQASYRLAESIDTAVSGASQISEAVRRGAETLSRTSRETAEQAVTAVNESVAAIEKLHNAGDGNAARIERMAEMLEKLRRQIDQSSHFAKDHVSLLEKTVGEQNTILESSTNTLAEQVKAVVRALEEPVRMVGTAIADADGRHEQIQSTLERRVQDLKEASDKAINSVETIRQSLREQTQDITMLSGQVSSKARTLNEELAANKSLLTDTVDSALKDIARILEKVTAADGDIRETSGNITINLDDTAGEMETALHRLKNVSAQSTETMASNVDRIEDTARTVEARNEAVRKAVQLTTDMMASSGERILPLYEKIEQGSDKALEALKEVRNSYDDTAETALDKMHKVGIVFDERLVKLEKGATSAAGLLKSSGDYLGDRLDDIETAAKSADEKMRSIGSAMEAQSADIHIMADQTILKIENIQKLINEQFVELSQAVDQAVGRIEGAGDGFDTQSERITASADAILDRFAAAGDEAKARSDLLRQAANDVAGMAEQSVSRISAQMETLEKSGETALSNLAKTGDTLSIKSKEIDANMRQVLDQSKSYAQEMRDQVLLMAEQNDNCVDAINGSVSTLKTCMDSVNSKTKDVVSLIQDSNRSLYEQSGRFVTAVTKSVEVAEQATDMFSRQSDNMLKAAQIAVEKAEGIRAAEILAQREVFMSSARFVLESLHSLSIDFVRSFDGSVSDKNWKQYQKGDVALFTSQLAANVDAMPADKIRNKYEDDTEFRGYVQKYIRHFEDILDHAGDFDRGAVLSTAFMASDVGKIYRFLCNVTGKEAKTRQKDMAKAA